MGALDDAYETTFGPRTLDDSAITDQEDVTWRLVIGDGLLSASGGMVRLSFSRDHTSDYEITECWIGHQGSGGDESDFDGNQVQVTFDGGNTSTTIEADGQQSDDIAFDLDASKYLVVSCYIGNATAGDDIPNKNLSGISCWRVYDQTAGNRAGNDTLATPKSAWRAQIIVKKIEVVEGVVAQLAMDLDYVTDNPERGMSAAAGMSITITAEIEKEAGIAGTAGLGYSVDAYVESSRSLDLGGAIGFEAEALNWSQWLLQNRDLAVPRYYLTLTGDADGTTDLEIPIRSFSGRLRSGNPTYLQVVIPEFDTYVSEVVAREHGDLKLEMAWEIQGEESVRETLCIVDLEAIRTDEGSKNKSITVSGHRTTTPPAKTTFLQDVTYRSMDKGALHIRSAMPDLYLQPGDTARYVSDKFDDSFTVKIITYIVADSRHQMDVRE
ncbi:MAG: hypothetical protein PVG49_09250 [Desulfobacteraceae bacterium]|jgi:hypothetical protein